MTKDELIFKDIRTIVKLIEKNGDKAEKSFVYNQIRIKHINEPFRYGYSMDKVTPQSWKSVGGTVRSIISGIRRGIRKGNIFNGSVGMKKIGGKEYLFTRKKDFKFDKCSFVNQLTV